MKGLQIVFLRGLIPRTKWSFARYVYLYFTFCSLQCPYFPCPTRPLIYPQTTYVLGNIANGSRSQQDLIFTHPHILGGMYRCLADAHPGTRVPLVGCILSLLQTNQRRKRDLIEAGFISTLRHLCERGSGVGSGTHGVAGSGTSAGSSGVSMSIAMGSMSVSPGGMRHPLHHHYYHHSPHRHPICPEDDKEAAVLARQVLDLMEPSTVGELL